MGKTGLSIAAFVVGAMIAGKVAAQDEASALAQCRSLADDVSRLACYDRVADGINAGLPAIASDSAPRVDGDGVSAVASVSAETLEDAFGAEDLASEKRKRIEDEKPKSLTANVVDIARNRRGKYVVILDNGQVWRQINADTDNLRVPKRATGLQAEIKRKTLGGYALSLETGNRTIRVERLK